jgi:hypothetical protein
VCDRCQASGFSLATEKKKIDLIEKENTVLKIPNLKHQITNNTQIPSTNDRHF